jgi:protein JSN1
MIASGIHASSLTSDGVSKPPGWTPSITEQQMIMRELSVGSVDAETDIAALAG